MPNHELKKHVGRGPGGITLCPLHAELHPPDTGKAAPEAFFSTPTPLEPPALLAPWCSWPTWGTRILETSRNSPKSPQKARRLCPGLSRLAGPPPQCLPELRVSQLRLCQSCGVHCEGPSPILFDVFRVVEQQQTRFCRIVHFASYGLGLRKDMCKDGPTANVACFSSFGDSSANKR